MRSEYPDLDIRFSVENVSIQTLNMKYDSFSRQIPFHSHGAGCYEIHYIPRGYGTLQTENASYDLVPNTLFITGPHVRHAQTPRDDDPMREYCLYLRIRKTDGKAASPILEAFTSTPFWIGQDVHGIHGRMTSLFEELEAQRTGYREQVRSLLSQIFVCIVRNYEQAKDGDARPAKPLPVDNRSMIIEEYFLYEFASLSLDELAGRLYLSPRQTQRLLQEYYGKSFQEKKTEARMSAAALLLSDPRRSIASVAEALGYAAPEQFSTAFKAYYHVSPLRFQSNLGK